MKYMLLIVPESEGGMEDASPEEMKAAIELATNPVQRSFLKRRLAELSQR